MQDSKTSVVLSQRNDGPPTIPRFPRFGAICMALASAMTIASGARADTFVTYDFSGFVQGSSIEITAATFSGEVTYDVSVGNSNTGAYGLTNGLYYQPSNSYIQFSSGTFVTGNPLSDVVTQYENPNYTNDTLGFQSGEVSIEFDSANGASLSSDAIPSVVPPLSDFTLYDRITVDLGQINGTITSFTPVTAAPEPMSVVMLGTGLVGILSARRRRHKRNRQGAGVQR